jgi:trk system potassium uptake protein TrkA
VKAIVVGCGRVGSGLARSLAEAGWDVAVVDRSQEAWERLGKDWRGEFVAGHALDTDVLERAGIADADALFAATSGDNTNIVVAQVAKRRYDVPQVAARLLDPARAEFYADHGFEVVSPTQTAVASLAAWAQAATPRAS